jgi:hypothetical protein
MVMDYALQTIEEITMMASVAHFKEEIDTPVVSKKGLVMTIGGALYEEDVEYAEMWKNTFNHIWDAIVSFWATNSPFNYVTTNGGLWIDMNEVIEAMAAQKEAA